MKARNYIGGLTIIVLGLVLLPIISIVVATILILYGFSLYLAEATARFPAYYLTCQITPTMDQEALTRYGFLVEELREQYRDRCELFRRTPRIGRLGNQPVRHRRKDLKRMIRVSETRLRNTVTPTTPTKHAITMEDCTWIDAGYGFEAQLRKYQ